MIITQALIRAWTLLLQEESKVNLACTNIVIPRWEVKIFLIFKAYMLGT